MLVFPQENEFRTGLSSNLVPWIDRFADHILPQIDIFYPWATIHQKFDSTYFFPTLMDIFVTI